MNIWWVLGLLTLGLALAWWFVDRQAKHKSEKTNQESKYLATNQSSLNSDSLYNRLGGIYAIAAVVDYFSDRLIENPVVGKQSKNPYLNDWNNHHLDRLAGLKFMRTLWLAALAGGPFQYTGTKPGKCPFSLENAHKDLHITPEEFDAVAQELSLSLDHFQVPDREKQQVLQAFVAHKHEINTGQLPASAHC